MSSKKALGCSRAAKCPPWIPIRTRENVFQKGTAYLGVRLVKHKIRINLLSPHSRQPEMLARKRRVPKRLFLRDREAFESPGRIHLCSIWIQAAGEGRCKPVKADHE